jgi:hypothetical protein
MASTASITRFGPAAGATAPPSSATIQRSVDGCGHAADHDLEWRGRYVATQPIGVRQRDGLDRSVGGQRSGRRRTVRRQRAYIWLPHDPAPGDFGMIRRSGRRPSPIVLNAADARGRSGMAADIVPIISIVFEAATPKTISG